MTKITNKIKSCSSEQNVEVTELDLNKIESLNENYIEIEKRINESKGWYIGEIENPSSILQLSAMLINPYVIREIKTPSNVVIDYINSNKEVQHSILLSDAESIKYINKPTEKQQLLAVGLCPDSIRFIEMPSIKTIKYVKKYKKINMDYKSQLKAVRKNGKNLKYMYYKSDLLPSVDEKIQLEAIKNNYKAVKWLNIEIFNKNSIIEKYILSNEIVLNEMLLHDPFFIEEVDSPNRENQLALIKGLKKFKLYIQDIDYLVKKEDKIPELIEFENNLMYMC